MSSIKFSPVYVSTQLQRISLIFTTQAPELVFYDYEVIFYALKMNSKTLVQVPYNNPKFGQVLKGNHSKKSARKIFTPIEF